MSIVTTDRMVNEAGPKTAPSRAKSLEDRPAPAGRTTPKVVQEIETAVYSAVICCAFEAEQD